MRFPQTRWSLVARAGAGGAAPAQRVALEELCRAYWSPLYAFVRLEGYPKDAAEDLVQGFFADFLARGGFGRAQADRGRLRSYLLASLKHHVSHAQVRSAAAKRGRALTTTAAIDQIEALIDRESLSDPDEGFMRAWAQAVLERVLTGLGQEYAARGKRAVFDALAPSITAPQAPTADLAATLGISVGAVKVAMHRLRRRFGDRLRAEVAHTVVDSAGVDGELRALIEAMQGL